MNLRSKEAEDDFSISDSDKKRLPKRKRAPGKFKSESEATHLDVVEDEDLDDILIERLVARSGKSISEWGDIIENRSRWFQTVEDDVDLSLEE